MHRSPLPTNGCETRQPSPTRPPDPPSRLRVAVLTSRDTLPSLVWHTRGWLLAAPSPHVPGRFEGFRARKNLILLPVSTTISTAVSTTISTAVSTVSTTISTVMRDTTMLLSHSYITANTAKFDSISYYTYK